MIATDELLGFDDWDSQHAPGRYSLGSEAEASRVSSLSGLSPQPIPSYRPHHSEVPVDDSGDGTLPVISYTTNEPTYNNNNNIK